MKKTINTLFQKRWMLVLIFSLASAQSFGQQKTQVMAQVVETVALNEATELTITNATTPFGDNGVVELNNPDACIILPYVKPSMVYNQWLSHIRVNGKTATRNTWAAIWDNGAIVYPHAKDTFTPLTVFTDVNYGGKQRGDFLPWEFYNNVSSLGEMDNQIRSFKLKRGYMVTFATNYDGTGYSRVFIAQDADVEVAELQRELKGRIGFIRVFPWNRVSKKGCGAFDWNPGNVLNVTWGYDWGAGGSPFPEDVDYVGMHHHEDWPSYGEISTARGFNTVLGNNEPDNLNDLSQNPIPAGQMEAVLFGENGLTGSWRNIYKGGYRVGSPAMAGDYAFLRQFMDLCRKYNYRIDFVATHRYLMGTGWDYDWFVNDIYNQYHLPVWITEWNYGAEWNGFLDQGPDFFRDRIADIIPILEANPHLERQAFFNVLGDANRMMTNRHEGMRLMPAGEWYRDYSSSKSYTGGEDYVMVWNYWAPQDLSVSWDEMKRTATLKWLNLNGKQTDSTLVERQLEGQDGWTVIDRRYLQGQAQQIFRSDTLRGITGLVKYRVRNYDSDGRIRMTGEVELPIAGSAGNTDIQFGNIIVQQCLQSVKVDFTEDMGNVPIVFIGPSSASNLQTVTEPLFLRGNISAAGFTYTPLPWCCQPNGETLFTKNEQVGFVALHSGHRQLKEGFDLEVGQFSTRDMVEVEFEQPFPDGVTPIVIISVTRSTQTSLPTLHKIWDVTNRGFKCELMYEEGSGSKVGTNQQVGYLAVSPGQALLDKNLGLYVAAGRGERKIYGVAREIPLKVSNGDDEEQLFLKEPVVLAGLQTNNTPVPATLRLSAKVEGYKQDADGDDNGPYVTGLRFLRTVDKSVNTSREIDNSSSADEVGGVVLHSTGNSDATAIERVITFNSENPLQVRVCNRMVFVENHDHFELFSIGGVRVASNSTQSPGIYIVKAGGKTAKIMVR